MKSSPRLSWLTASICCLAVFGLPPQVAAQQLLGVFDLANADVTFNGIDLGDDSGGSVSTAGDVNGDGLDDLLIGANLADPNDAFYAGETYLIYGRSGSSTLSGMFELAGADVIFNGNDSGDHSGRVVSSAGDVNGDGLDDLLINAISADPNGIPDAGEVYLIYGRNGTNPLSGMFDLSAADVNGDGLADLLIGARDGGPNGAGETYLIYGRAIIPEPTTAALLVVAGMILFTTRRTRCLRLRCVNPSSP